MKIYAAAALALVALGATGAVAKGKTKVVPVKQGELYLYQQTKFAGEAYEIDRANSNIQTDWNVKSIGIFPGDSWEICAKPSFRAPCLVLTESVEDASSIGIYGGIGSARKAKPAKK